MADPKPRNVVQDGFWDRPSEPERAAGECWTRAGMRMVVWPRRPVFLDSMRAWSRAADMIDHLLVAGFVAYTRNYRPGGRTLHARGHFSRSRLFDDMAAAKQAIDHRNEEERRKRGHEEA